MFEVNVDFDAIRERVYDTLFAWAGVLGEAFEDFSYDVEEAVDRLNNAAA